MPDHMLRRSYALIGLLCFGGIGVSDVNDGASRPKTQRWLLTTAIALTVVGELAVIRHGVPYLYAMDQPRTRRMQVFVSHTFMPLCGGVQC